MLADADFERDLLTFRPLSESRRVLALRGDEILGILILNFRRDGSPGSEDYAAHVDVAGGVSRESRRQGVGRLLLSGLTEFMERYGKSIATTKVHLPDGHACMTRVGATSKLRMVENRLSFDALDWASLERWGQAPDLAASGLRWEVHAGRVPMETLAPLMAPFSVLINEQPLDELEVPRMRYELHGYETWYADMDRRGGDHFLVLLRRGDEVAAMCDASWDLRFPERMYQQLTAVARPWRGRGLAKAVKARMLELVRTSHLEVRMAITHNANANSAMRSINDRLGFRVHKEECTYQADLRVMQAYLAGR